MEIDEKTIRNDKDKSNASDSNSEQICCDAADYCGDDVDPCECYTESCCC